MSLKHVAMLAGFCIFATLLFPPFHTTISVMGATQNAGYGFILSPPADGARIDIAVLLVQWLGILLISALLAYMPSLAGFIDIVKGGVKAEKQEKEEVAKIDFGPKTVKVLMPIFRFGLFALTAMGVTGCVFLAGRFIVYELLQIASDDFSRPAMAFEFVVIPLLIIIVFRKIFLQRSSKAQVIGLGFYLSCILIAILLVSINRAELAPPFEWLGLVGMAAYFIIRPFKKDRSMAE